MAGDDALVPVFVPPLALALAHAERQKKSPLTREEAESVRDKSVCIMTASIDAQRMNEAHGFRDVNPQNCWADWHRLRAKLVGGYLPKIVLCIPGEDAFRVRSEKILGDAKVTFEFQQHDPNMVRAFKASSTTWPSLTPEDYICIESHTQVLYVLSESIESATASAIGLTFMSLGRKLLEAGGLAIKCESSGIAHSRERWCRLDIDANHNAISQWESLFRAYVCSPIAAASDIYSCGMHLLGAPDMIVSQDVARREGHAERSKVSGIAHLFRCFGSYVTAECPVGSFISGHTFSVDENSNRYRVIWEPCAGFAEDDFFFNPFGRWRFTMP